MCSSDPMVMERLMRALITDPSNRPREVNNRMERRGEGSSVENTSKQCGMDS